MRFFCSIFIFGLVWAIESQFPFSATPQSSSTEVYYHLLKESKVNPQQTLDALENGVFQCIPGISKSDDGATEAAFIVPKMLIKMVEMLDRGTTRDSGRAEMKAWLKNDMGGFVSSLSGKKANFVTSIIEIVTKDPTVRGCIAKAAL